jgi:hypothetical protein
VCRRAVVQAGRASGVRVCVRAGMRACGRADGRAGGRGTFSLSESARRVALTPVSEYCVGDVCGAEVVWL